MTIPKAFISYSHDTQEHKKWVLGLAIRLRNSGIDAILDQFELQPGDDIPHFMETNLAAAQKILMICSEKYIEKANSGQGGVGYEKMIITSYLMKRIDENKIIPIIRQGGTTDVPVFLKSKLYINFSRNDDFEFSYDNLVRAIYNAPLFEKPAIGNNPFLPIAKEKLDGDINLLNSVLAAIAAEQGILDHTYSIDVIRKLKISPSIYKVAVLKLIKLEYARWGSRDMSTVKITEKGLFYAYSNKLL